MNRVSGIMPCTGVPIWRRTWEPDLDQRSAATQAFCVTLPRRQAAPTVAPPWIRSFWSATTAFMMTRS